MWLIDLSFDTILHRTSHKTCFLKMNSTRTIQSLACDSALWQRNKFYRHFAFAHTSHSHAHCLWPFVKISHLNCFLSVGISTSSSCTFAINHERDWVNVSVVRFLQMVVVDNAMLIKISSNIAYRAFSLSWNAYRAYRFQYNQYVVRCTCSMKPQDNIFSHVSRTSTNTIHMFHLTDNHRHNSISLAFIFHSNRVPIY